MTLVSILIVSTLNIMFPYQLSFVIDSLVQLDSAQFTKGLGILLAIVLILLIFEFFSQYFSTLYLSQVGEKLHKSLIGRLVHADFLTFSQSSKGAYHSQIVNDIDRLKQEAYESQLTLVQGIFSLLIASLALLRLDRITAFLILLASILPVIIPYLFKNQVKANQNTISASQEKYSTVLNSFLNGFLEYKNLLPRQAVISKLENTYKDINLEINRASRFSALINCLVGLAFYLITFLIVFVGGSRIMAGKLSVGGLTAILIISEELIGPIHNITDSLMAIYSVKDIKEKFAENEREDLLPVQLKTTSPVSLHLDDISYRQADGKQVLKNFSYTFAPDKKYLITGKSGIGKSTLAYLLTQNLPLQDGEIRIKDQSITSYSYDDIQNLIAYIPQKTILIQDSVWNNLTFSRPVDPDVIWHLIEVFGLTDRFPSPETLNEILTEDSKLSGGQKQLLVLIRTLVSQKPILVIDEGLSALDEKTFNLVEEKLCQIPGLTFIHISHRISDQANRLYDERIDLPVLS